jgi:hypothetical protein
MPGNRLPARSTSEEPIHTRPHRENARYRGASGASINQAHARSELPAYGQCNSYFTFTQTPLMMGTTLLYQGPLLGS